MAEPFPVSGNIDPKAFPFLLADLHRRGATGSLKVEGPAFPKALYFRSGRILFGSSNDPGDQLGSILIEQGKITQEQLEDVNAKVGPGNPLAKVLAESGYVNQRELGEAARIKVERILSDVIGYSTGSFEFEDGVLPKGAVDLKLSTEKLILSAVKRLDDRAFVLRHLGSLTATLAPTESFAAHAEELHADSGELPDRLDGRRTLKEAAALTHLDEFEAAKVACALLFLGFVRPHEPGEEPIAPFPAADELDLSQTARSALSQPPVDATIAMAGPDVGGETESPFFTDPGLTAGSPLRTDEVPGFSSPNDTAFPIMPPAPAEPETEAFVLPAVQPPAAPPSPPPPLPAPPVPRTAVLPAPSPAGTGAFGAFEDQPVGPATSRPSKEDLAALDALLNPNVSRGPVQPLAPTKGERWEPQFPAVPVRRPNRKPRGSMMLPFSVVAVLGFGGAGAWYYYRIWLPQQNHSDVPVVPTAPPSVAVASPLPTAVPTSLPTPATTPSALPLPSPSAAPTPAPTLAPTPAPVGPATGGGGRELLQSGSFPEAATAFAANLRAARGFSVQVLVACSTDTIQKAVQAVPSEEIYILPVNFKGKSCYRLCWGVYDSEGRASFALQSLPEYFRQGGATPKVQPVASLLP